MIWHRLQLMVISGTVLLLAFLGVGMTVLLDRGEKASLAGAEAALERSAQALENALNRPLLQVHGALASLPDLFKTARISPTDTAAANQLLRGLNFQTLAFRDLLLVGAGNVILASARAAAPGRLLPIEHAALGAGSTALLGPVRNPLTGDWSLYVTRAVSGWDGITSVAEVPLTTLMTILSETGVLPGARIMLERPDGQLLGALPHDEILTGRIRPNAPGTGTADGTAVPVQVEGEDMLVVVRATLYKDARIVVMMPRDTALAGWARERDRTILAAALGCLAVMAFAGTLLVALRQRELAEADRTKAATVLANAVGAMSDGFAMWDEHDRLVTCNQPYRDLYPHAAPLLVPGVRFEDALRKSTQAGQFPAGTADVDRFVGETTRWHRTAGKPMELRLASGRWVLMKESATPDGGMVSLRTDITPLKTTLANLAEANARANDAIEETQRQNDILIERESRIRFLAHHDDLTGLPNRVLFRSQIQAAIETTQDSRMRMALLYLDLDRFKDVNDTLGHPVGDALLRAVATRLRACANESQCARLSGDEFAVISLDPAQPQQAEALSLAIIEALSRPYHILGHTIVISVSVGLAVAEGADTDSDSLLKQADLALYQAKGQGRGRVCVFVPEMDAYLHTRLQMEADLRIALARQQFTLVYQPIFSFVSQRVSGFEALLRWHHPRLGLISPASFVPLTEETGLIVDIGSWALRQACSDARAMPEHVKVAVNLSPVQLSSGGLVEVVVDALSASGLDAGRLELEITETALFAESERNRDVLRQLKALGAGLVLDDFGTGYSSLSHLKIFAVDKIKIDRSFVADMALNADSAAIVEAIAGLALRLGITATAEGIETIEQLGIARRAGCTEVQGYYLGLPLPLHEALARAQASPFNAVPGRGALDRGPR